MILNNKKSQARAGSYMCESSNSVGKGRSKEITLDIKCKMMMLVMVMVKMMMTMMLMMIMIANNNNTNNKPSDMPVCANPEPEIYGVSKSELVDIVCRVQANPSEVGTS